MMSTVIEQKKLRSAGINTQDESLRQNGEDKVRGRGRGVEWGKRMKRGGGVKDRDERSRGMEIRISSGSG